MVTRTMSSTAPLHNTGSAVPRDEALSSLLEPSWAIDSGNPQVSKPHCSHARPRRRHALCVTRENRTRFSETVAMWLWCTRQCAGVRKGLWNLGAVAHTVERRDLEVDARWLSMRTCWITDSLPRRRLSLAHRVCVGPCTGGPSPARLCTTLYRRRRMYVCLRKHALGRVMVRLLRFGRAPKLQHSVSRLDVLERGPMCLATLYCS